METKHIEKSHTISIVKHGLKTDSVHVYAGNCLVAGTAGFGRRVTPTTRATEEIARRLPNYRMRTPLTRFGLRYIMLFRAPSLDL